MWLCVIIVCIFLSKQKTLRPLWLRRQVSSAVNSTQCHMSHIKKKCLCHPKLRSLVVFPAPSEWSATWMTGQMGSLEESYLACMSDWKYVCMTDIALLPRCSPCNNHFVRVPKSSLCLLLLLMMVNGCNFCSKPVL